MSNGNFRGPSVPRANSRSGGPPTRRELASHETSYGGRRDLYDALGYDETENIAFESHLGRYQRDGIATALVDRFVDATWQTYPTVSDGSTPPSESDVEHAPTSEFEKAVSKLFSGDALDDPMGTSLRPSVGEAIEMADTFATLGEYSLLFLGFADGDDADLSDPVEQSSFGGDGGDFSGLVYTTPIAQNQVGHIETEDEDRSDPMYGLPVEYEIRFNDKKEGTERVHHSRVIHIPEGTRQSAIKGTPTYLKGWNRFDDIEKLLGGSAEQAWRGAYQGIVVQPPRDGDGNITKFDPDDTDIEKQIAEHRHNMRRAIRSTGEVSTLESNIADVSNNIEMQFRALAAAYDIPQSILMGNETGERATQEDKGDFEETIASRRNRQAEQRELRPLIDRLVYVGVLPDPDGGEYDFHWQSLTELSESEWADLMHTKAQSIDLLSSGSPDRMFSMEELRVIMDYPPERGSLTDTPDDDGPVEGDSDPAEEIDEMASPSFDDMTSGAPENGDGQ